MIQKTTIKIKKKNQNKKNNYLRKEKPMELLTPDDMSNLFLFFRIPTPLYEKWQQYARDTQQEMKPALAELLASVSKQVLVPPYESLRIY